jgi:uncharacterized membrane protein
MTSRSFDVLNLGLLALAAGASVAVYDRLPALMAIHFDAFGHANGWTDRSVGAFALPAVGLGLYLLLRIVDRVKSVPVFLTTALTALFVGLHLAVLKFNLGSETIMATVLPFALGLFMLVLGQTLPRTRQNGLVGFRTPWTMRSKENWYATHRFSGLLLTLGGAISIFAGAFVPVLATPITVVALLGASLAGTVYSFVHARKTAT